MASLRARITLLVVAATVLTSLAVTAMSVHSIDSFLRRRINDKFPSILAATNLRIDFWYQQTRLDLDTFARSDALIDGVRQFDTRKSAKRELRQYLSYVLQRFDAFESLFVFDRRGRERMWVGERVDLSDEMLERLLTVQEPTVERYSHGDGRTRQVVAVAVLTSSGKQLGTLAGTLRLDALAALLTSDHLGEAGEIFLVDERGRYVTRSRGAAAGEPCLRPIATAEGATEVREYDDPQGERVVGAALPLERFGWTLIVEEPYSMAFEPIIGLVHRVVGINLAIVVVFSLAALRIAVSIVRPIQALSDGARRVAAGETGVVVMETTTADEIRVLTRSFNQMTRQLQDSAAALRTQRELVEETNEELRAKNEELERLSITDELTGLFNHRHFQEQLSHEIAQARRSGGDLSLLLIDIDDFKRLNDNWGHAAGDAVLRKVAEVLREALREADVPCRYGGEEFALLLAGSDLEGALMLAERIRTVIESATVTVQNDQGVHELSVTVSIGAGVFRGDRAALFNEADEALYRAKASGKNCVATLDE